MYQDQFVLGKLVHSGELNRAVPALRALTVQGAVSVMKGTHNSSVFEVISLFS